MKREKERESKKEKGVNGAVHEIGVASIIPLFLSLSFYVCS